MTRRPLLGVCLSALVCGVPAVVAAGDLVALSARVRPAFCFIAGGSGVLVRPDGLMLTNDHVLEGRRSFDVRIGDGRSFQARVLGRDTVGDLALLRLDVPAGTELPWLPLGDSEALSVGDDVLAVGNPFGLGVLDQAPTFTVGIVSALHHVQGSYTECIVTDAAVNPGNSGGPLVNMAGEIVGINGQISTRYGLRSNTGLGFAISARQIALWLPRLEAAGGGEVPHGRLVGLELAPADDGPTPALVRDVAEGSAAAEAGFRPGDEIVRLDGVAVPDRQRLAGLVGIYPAGARVTVAVRRAGDEVAVEAVLGPPQRCLVGLELVRPRGSDLAVRVEAVAAGSPAAMAGLRPGDEIVEVRGRRLAFTGRDERRAFDRWLRTSVFVGDIVPLTVRREDGAGGVREVDLRLIGR